MDKVDKYGEIIQKVIQEYAGDRYTRKDVDRELIFDTKNHHYQIVHVGWEGDRRVYGCVLHFDIKGGFVVIAIENPLRFSVVPDMKGEPSGSYITLFL
ncbi:MAG: XisI protein [Okeania sp. SIO3I5]|uniref:element excision factor XisI family protein n=1 Tax=Okeania sp. SIO3I5 TaxID=2607805 RepID=UPI0013BCBF41|nr:element excision factor XisI family protein [Okeania sp. SIO3I5]NEQ37291.1 XisI protein [Okeania sp. SIO3I5]